MISKQGGYCRGSMAGSRNRSGGPGQESTEVKNMSLYLSERYWGRSCLHLAAAIRAGHWRWHRGGLGREVHFTRPLTRKATANG